MNFFDRIRSKIVQLYRNVRENGINCNKIKEFPHKAYEWFIQHENRKLIVKASGMWLAVFLVIIIVCRVSGNPKVSASVEEQTTVLERESTMETSNKGKTVLKETQPETTQQITETEPATEPVATEPVTEEPVSVERETIPIEKIEVSKTVLRDDVASVPKTVETVEPVNVTTVSSVKLESSRYAHCIDISYHQGEIDWAAVKASGIDYAIIRVGYRGYETGKLGKDIRFDENIQGAIDNDIKVGVYIFSQAITEQEALEEASITLNYIKNYKISLPVVIDWETTAGYRTYNAGLSRSQLTSILSTFCDTVKKYGYEPMVYMCKSDYQNRIDASKIASKYQTWVAWYFSEYNTNNYAENIFKYGDELPDMSFDYYMWQYSSKGSVNGINGCVDMNVILLPEVKYDVKLNVTNTSIVTNVNTPVDLMEGVSASGSNGKNTTSDIVLNIINATGGVVSQEKAFATSGSYSLNYRYTDMDGTVINKKISLYVRALPVIYFEGNIWRDESIISLSYDYDESRSEQENYDEIIGLLDEKLSACYYDMVEGVSPARDITEKEYEGIEKLMTDGGIASGETLITYKVSDGNGLSNSRTLSLNIIRKQSEENTSEYSEDVETTADSY